MEPQTSTTPRGRGLLRVLTEMPYLSVRAEVGEMTVDEARDVWSHVGRYLVGASARAGSRGAGLKWNGLVRKLLLIRDKAEESER